MAAVEHAGVLDHLVERDAAVRAPEREGEAGARGRERLEAERRQYPRRARVPGVGDHERLALVQRAKVRGPYCSCQLLHGHLGFLQYVSPTATSMKQHGAEFREMSNCAACGNELD